MKFGNRKGAFHSLGMVALLSLGIGAVLVVLLFWSPASERDQTAGESVFMYCAAGMRVPVNEIAEQYASQSFGQLVQLQYGGSNTVLNQLELAGIGDLYLAADDSYMKLAVEKGLVQETIPVAWIRPVVAIAKGNPKNIHTVEDLLSEDVRLALANPEAAAVGKKTRQLMEASGHWEALSKHAVVTMPTVNEIANSVKVGSVDAGIVWDVIVAQYSELEAVRLPELDAGAAQIVIGMLSSSEQPAAALRFARYLTARDKGLGIFRQHGYESVEGDIWELQPNLTVYSGGVNRVAIEETIERFERREEVQINVVYNGCGVLSAQMKALHAGDRHGVFPDAYFACDVSFMDQVKDLFVDPTNVSETDMVIITGPGNQHGIEMLEDLGAPGIKLGVANADESALGGLTRRLLRELGIADDLQTNVSTETPTADMLVNAVKVGGLDAAIVYRANTSQVADDLTVIDIDHPLARAVQPYAAARDTAHGHTVDRLMAAIRRSRSNFEAAGFRYLLDVPTP
jgi:molybdate transport system substrate-binding protein